MFHEIAELLPLINFIGVYLLFSNLIFLGLIVFVVLSHTFRMDVESFRMAYKTKYGASDMRSIITPQKSTTLQVRGEL